MFTFTIGNVKQSTLESAEKLSGSTSIGQNGYRYRYRYTTDSSASPAINTRLSINIVDVTCLHGIDALSDGAQSAVGATPGTLQYLAATCSRSDKVK